MQVFPDACKLEPYYVLQTLKHKTDRVTRPPNGHSGAAHHLARMLSSDLGPDFMALFDDNDVTEIIAPPTMDTVLIDTHSSGIKATTVSLPKPTVLSFLNRCADDQGVPITASYPRIEYALPDRIFRGSRLTGVVPPAVEAPMFCLRKFSNTVIPLSAYVEQGVITDYQESVILNALKRKRSIAVVGGTGSGKTTLQMTLLDLVTRWDPLSHIITMEDTREIDLPHSRAWTPLTVYPGGSLADLIEMSLRLSPDRIVVGECRGRGLVSLFEAFISGHPGGVFTYHAHRVEEALTRMLINCKQDSDTDSHRHTIGQAIDLIIILEKSHGRRFVPQMVRVNGFSDEQGYDLAWIPREDGVTLPFGHYYSPFADHIVDPDAVLTSESPA